MPRHLTLLLLLGVLAPSCAGLEQRVRARLAGTPGHWGLYFRDLRSLQTLAIDADEGFHPASTRKILVLLKVYADIGAGQYRLGDLLDVRDSFPSAVSGAPPFRVGAGSDAVRQAVGGRLSIRALVHWMIKASDNLATNLLIRTAGGADAVTAHARSLGLSRSSVRTYVGDVAAHRAGLRSVGVPREYGLLLERLWRAKPSRDRVQGGVLEILGRPLPGWMGRRLPRSVRIAHKPGRIEAVRSDAALVTLPGGRTYVLCIIGENLSDGRSAEETIADVSRLVFDHVSRKSGRPAATRRGVARSGKGD